MAAAAAVAAGEESIAMVETRLRELCVEASIDEEAASNLWVTLSNRYTEEHRRYHTLSHISELLVLSRASRELLKCPSCVDWAILYHDVIYDASSKTNEEDSAELFALEVSSPFLSGSEDARRMGELVYEYIIATKKHDVGASEDRDLQLFVDWDMSVLGREQSGYAAYVAQVRQEYSHLTSEAWAAGRSAFLEHTLASGAFIFATPEVRGVREDQAKQNMAWELSVLKQ